MSTIENFQIPFYLGKWYEVAKYKNPWEFNCAFAKANYTWNRDNNTINVINTCYDKNNRLVSTAEGIARIPDMNDRSKLKVKFYSFIQNKSDKDELDVLEKQFSKMNFSQFGEKYPMREEEGDYYVHWTDYKNYSIVGSPDKRYLWVLSRKPFIPAADALFIVELVKKFGYDPDKLLSNRRLVK
jgi:apolipoprotein D and lipocalin family protein